jgi:hypothetical protein
LGQAERTGHGALRRSGNAQANSRRVGRLGRPWPPRLGGGPPQGHPPLCRARRRSHSAPHAGEARAEPRPRERSTAAPPPGQPAAESPQGLARQTSSTLRPPCRCTGGCPGTWTTRSSATTAPQTGQRQNPPRWSWVPVELVVTVASWWSLTPLQADLTRAVQPRGRPVTRRARSEGEALDRAGAGCNPGIPRAHRRSRRRRRRPWSA